MRLWRKALAGASAAAGVVASRVRRLRLRRRRSERAGSRRAAEPAMTLGATTSRPRDADRRTRRRLDAWDRSKYLVLGSVLLGFFWWQKLNANPIKSVADGFWETVETQAWLWILLGLEVLRQLHFVVAEHWSGYYRFWKFKVFGRVENRQSRMDPWVRFRIGRVLRILFWLLLFGVIVGQFTDQNPVAALIGLPGLLNSWLPWAARLIIYPLLLISQFVLLFWFLSRGGVETYFPDDIDTRFDDVWGQDPVKERVRENLIFLENPESIEEVGGYAPGGILLYGPPGTGKTLLAEAAAGETGKPFVFVEPGAFMNMFFGVGILKVKGLFRKLRKLALRYGGVVAFFDEADALGNRGAAVGGDGGFRSERLAAFLRDATEPGSSYPYLSPGARRVLQEAAWGGCDQAGSLAAYGGGPWTGAGPRRESIMMMGGGGGGMGTLQALLAELSGLKKPRGFFNRIVRKMLGMRPKPPPKYRILVMMASNLPEALDPAMLRPGRIDRIYKVGYPTQEGRKRTYEGYLDKVDHVLADDDVEKLATITPYATGATIKDMVNEALITAIRDGRRVITWADMIKAKQLKEHGLADDFDYVEHERHALAVHEACHAVALHRVSRHRMIDLATIERRGTVGGFVSHIPPEDRFTHWRSEYEADLEVSLASLAGERMFFGDDNSSGVGGDLRNATQLAAMMSGYWGMGDTLASHAVQRQFGIGGGQRKGDEEDPERELLRKGLGDQIEQRLADRYDAVRCLLEANRVEVLAVAHALETHKTITGDDVSAIVDRDVGPFLDGRGYYRPDAVEALEGYHAAVLELRRTGGMELPPLPRISGITGRLVETVAVPAPVPVGAGAAAGSESSSSSGSDDQDD
ncbi:MAG: AAA family ATPase [Acidimicrobiaceae bacterium]|nr:AAA family ATPase [Acidimicrobiaceae bacterium]